MAKRKIDEQISYNWLFAVLGGAFLFVTGWAVWDETVTRREWKDYQERFFAIAADLAKQNLERQQRLLDPEQCPATCAAMYEGKRDAAKRCDEQCGKANRLAELVAKRDELREQARARAADIAALQKKVEQLKEAEFDINQEWTFTKAEWSEQDYYLRLARHAYLEDPDDPAKKAKFEAEKAKADELAHRAAEEGKRVQDAIAARKAAEAELAKVQHADEIKALDKEIESLRRPLAEAQRAYDKALADRGGLFGAKTEVKQFNLPKIGAVDRCTSCHMGTTRAGFEEVDEPEFRSHPFRRTLLLKHPPEDFGCTSCHDGQGRATTKFFAHAPSLDEDPHAFHVHYWERPLLKGPPGGDGTEFMEAKCRGCHEHQTELRSEILCAVDAECAPLSTDKRPAFCRLPKPQGAAAARLSLATLPGTPEGVEPPPAPQQKVCTDRRGNPIIADLAPNYTAGVRIVEEVGCYGCHAIDGFRDLPKPAPALTQVSKKVDPAYMVSWIQNPKDHRPNSRMPNFFPELLAPEIYPYPVDVEARKRKRDHEARALAAFLLSQSEHSDKYAYEIERPPAGLRGDAARGKQTMAEVGCAACHDLPGDEAHTPKRHNRASHFDHGPDLRDIGAKTSVAWIYSWLRDPKRYAPTTRMPNLRLTPQEALDIATYLGTLKGDKPIPPVSRDELADPDLIAEGKQLVKTYGCFGCHLVEGFETTPGIGADLSAFGVKLPERLDFGDFITDHNQQTWANWTINKLRHPRVYAYDAQNPVISYMPEFGFTEDEIRKVMVFLKSLRGTADQSAQVMAQKLDDDELARERGRRMLHLYNCYGCHNVDGHVGDLASLPALSGSNSIFGPPPLTNEGLKAQPTWLFNFLKRPFRMRPLPKVRMPTFGFTDREATDLVRMFSAIDGAVFPFTYHGDVGPRDDHERRIGKAIFDAAGCQKCHVVGELGDGPVPPEVKAPNLLMAKDRLRAEWLTLWLADPGAMQKNTAMPAFWLGGNQMDMFLQTNPEFRAAVDGIPQDVIDRYRTSPQLQIEATRNYLFRLQAGE